MQKRILAPAIAFTVVAGLSGVYLGNHNPLPAQAATGAQSASLAPAAATSPAPSRGDRDNRPGNRGGLSGKLVAITAQTITIQGFMGNQSIARAASLRFYSASKSSTKALIAGENIVIRTSANSAIATTISVSPAGSLYGSVIAMRSGGMMQPSGTPMRSSGTPTRDDATRGPGQFTPAIAGTLVSVQGNSVTVKTAQGQQKTVTLNSATTVYQFSLTSAGAVKVGAQVGIATAIVSGKQQAIALAVSTIPNVVATISATA